MRGGGALGLGGGGGADDVEVGDDVPRRVPDDAGPRALGHLLDVHGEDVLGGDKGVDEDDGRDVVAEEPAAGRRWGGVEGV